MSATQRMENKSEKILVSSISVTLKDPLTGGMLLYPFQVVVSDPSYNQQKES